MATKREELEAQVLAAEAEAEKLKAEARERAEVAALQARLEAANNAKRDAPAIAKAEEEHGPIGRGIAVVEFPLGAVIVKKPTGAAWKAFFTSTKSLSDLTLDASEALVRRCRVYPDDAALSAIFDDSPSASVKLTSEIIALNHARDAEVSGK